jgi:peptidyl-dipeptidase A
MRPFFITSIVLLIAAFSLFGQQKKASSVSKEAREFLTMYNAVYQKLYTVASNAEWKSSTDVTDQNTGERIGADQALVVFEGSTYVIEKCRELLKHKKELNALMVRQLEKIMLTAAHYPGTIPDVVTERVAAEATQSAILDGFRFCDEQRGDSCIKLTTPNQIDDILATSNDLVARKHAWEVSKQTGPALKSGLVKLQALRNRMGQEMGFKSFFALEVADYDMTVPEMMQLLTKTIKDINPLYQQLHYWAKNKIAAKFKQPVPKRIPAH